MLWRERIRSTKKAGEHCPVVISLLTYFLKEFFGPFKKVFIELVTILLLYYALGFWPWSR